MDSEALKRLAALKAMEWIEDGMVLGLGTGSTVRHLLEELGAARSRGELGSIVGVPTSEDTRRRAEALGIPLSDLSRHPEIDLTLDGADEVDPQLDLIKGLGGALLREKIVATASRAFIVLVDNSKIVDQLGQKAPLPVEIDPFSHGIQEIFLRGLGCEPRLRLASSGEPFRTDGGSWILDCHFARGIDDPGAIAAALDTRPGIIEHGLFLKMADRVIVASDDGIEVLERAEEGSCR